MSDSKSTSVVIFGASGDLTWRKLIPGLYNLHVKGRLPANFRVVGSSRRAYSSAEFRAKLPHWLATIYTGYLRSGDLGHLLRRLFTTFPATKRAGYLSRYRRFSEATGSDVANRLIISPFAPRFLPKPLLTWDHRAWYTKNRLATRCHRETVWNIDLKSAEALNDAIHAELDESQIYCIDHYLAKENAEYSRVPLRQYYF